MLSDRYRAVHISAFEGQKCWGIEDVAYNGDNLVRDWRYSGVKRKIWRGTQEQALLTARYLSDHPDILVKDARKNADAGQTRAIQSAQRRQQRWKYGIDMNQTSLIDLHPVNPNRSGLDQEGT